MALSATTTTLIVVVVVILIVVAGIVSTIYIIKKHEQDVTDDIIDRAGGHKDKATDTSPGGSGSSTTGTSTGGGEEPVAPPNSTALAIECGGKGEINYATISSYYYDDGNSNGGSSDWFNISNFFLTQFATSELVEMWKNSFGVMATLPGKGIKFNDEANPFTFWPIMRPWLLESPVPTVSPSQLHVDSAGCPGYILAYDPNLGTDNNKYLAYKFLKEFKEGEIILNIFLRITVIGYNLSPEATSTLYDLAPLRIAGYSSRTGFSSTKKYVEIDDMVGSDFLSSPQSIQFTFETKGKYSLGVFEMKPDDIFELKINWAEGVYFAIDRGVIGFSLVPQTE